MKDPPTDLKTVLEWRSALDPISDADPPERVPPDCWEDECEWMWVNVSDCNSNDLNLYPYVILYNNYERIYGYVGDSGSQ